MGQESEKPRRRVDDKHVVVVAVEVEGDDLAVPRKKVRILVVEDGRPASRAPLLDGAQAGEGRAFSNGEFDARAVGCVGTVANNGAAGDVVAVIPGAKEAVGVRRSVLLREKKQPRKDGTQL